MEEIKVGDYVRIAGGYIDKIQEIKLIHTVNGDQMGYKLKKMWFLSYIARDCIMKYSKNIIGVLEVGDFVNGYRVENVINEEPCPSGKCVDIDSGKDSSECTLWEEDIKTILTKEQYNEHCTKVGEQ